MKRSEPRGCARLAGSSARRSESLIVGRDFGIVTNIQTTPNGNLFVVSLDGGTVYAIFRTK